MRTLKIITLLFLGIITSLTLLQAANKASRKKLAFRVENVWQGRAEKSVPFIPVDAYVVDNNCIAIQFFCKGDSPSTFQIKDNDGHLIFQDILYLSEDDVYRIDIDGFNSGKYSLIYCDEYVEITGEFEKE